MNNKNNTSSTPRKRAVRKCKFQHFIAFLIFLTVTILGFSISPIIGLFGLVTLVATIVTFPFTLTQIKRNYCKNCGEKYDFKNDVGYEQEDVVELDKKVTATVAFECHCQNCGEIQEFRKKFTIATYNESKRTWSHQNLNNLCKKYFKIK